MQRMHFMTKLFTSSIVNVQIKTHYITFFVSEFVSVEANNRSLIDRNTKLLTNAAKAPDSQNRIIGPVSYLTTS